MISGRRSKIELDWPRLWHEVNRMHHQKLQSVRPVILRCDRERLVPANACSPGSADVSNSPSHDKRKYRTNPGNSPSA
jgi:hypothetical protein